VTLDTDPRRACDGMTERRTQLNTLGDVTVDRAEADY